jgi:hypothetical protein
MDKKRKCSICSCIFENERELGHHKIDAHGYSPKQLGWSFPSGWNRGLTQIEAFGPKGVGKHGNSEFMNSLNSPKYLEIKKSSRNHHEAMVLKREREFRAMEYKTFYTSNYSHHKRVPDIIAISPEGDIVAIEMESIRPYKPSRESISQRYTKLLMQENFFDSSIVEFFVVPAFISED